MLPWDSAYLDARDYQWGEVARPYWKDIDARARAADVRVCIEMHPHNVVYNPATMVRLVEQIGATHVGTEMDPSHLCWQGIDPVAALESLGGLVYTLSRWPTQASWDFVAVGRGHEIGFWTDFLRAISAIDPDMAVNIEHEDQELGQLEGLAFAADTLLRAAADL